MAKRATRTDTKETIGGELLPVFLKLDGKRVLVVGGGGVAASKIASLVRAGADVIVVAPHILPVISEAAVRCRRRGFRPSDLERCWLVVAAAPPTVNRAVAREAIRHRVFVNAVDDPRHASAYLGGVVRRSGVTIAVSTDGAAPAIAGLLREGLERLLPADLDRWMRQARELRLVWRRDQVPMTARRPQLLRALNALYAERSREARKPRVERHA